jgi:hypothetical protein
MIVSLTEEVGMSYVYVQLGSLDHALQLAAAKVERDKSSNLLKVKDAQDRIVGEFNLDAVAGWWVGQ